MTVVCVSLSCAFLGGGGEGGGGLSVLFLLLTGCQSRGGNCVTLKTISLLVSTHQLAPPGGLQLRRKVLDLPHDVGYPHGHLVAEEVERRLRVRRTTEVHEVLGRRRTWQFCILFWCVCVWLTRYIFCQYLGSVRTISCYVTKCWKG